MQHPVYPDTSEKEKIFGGIMTAAEFAWIASFSIIGVIVSLLSFKIIGLFCLILFFPFCGMGLALAFYKKQGMSLFQYLHLKQKFKKKQKKYPNRRKGTVLTLSTIEEEALNEY